LCLSIQYALCTDVDPIDITSIMSLYCHMINHCRPSNHTHISVWTIIDEKSYWIRLASIICVNKLKSSLVHFIDLYINVVLTTRLTLWSLIIRTELVHLTTMLQWFEFDHTAHDVVVVSLVYSSVFFFFFLFFVFFLFLSSSLSTSYRSILCTHH
jgi:hypothetical protein